MITCAHCSTPNLEGTYFCEDCGSPLIGVSTNTTLVMEKVSPQAANASSYDKPVWGTTALSSGTDIIIQFPNHQNEYVDLQSQRELLVGRRDEQANITPELDLTPYQGIENGVSRKHAILRRTDDTLTIIDLDSANGTYINGQRLIANQPHVLRDGDELSFGKLISHVYFK